MFLIFLWRTYIDVCNIFYITRYLRRTSTENVGPNLVFCYTFAPRTPLTADLWLTDTMKGLWALGLLLLDNCK